MLQDFYWYEYILMKKHDKTANTCKSLRWQNAQTLTQEGTHITKYERIKKDNQAIFILSLRRHSLNN